MTCDDVRLRLHEAHDEETMPGLSEAVQAHLASCTGCRELSADLNALSQALRALPGSSLPADALDEVWARTSRRSRSATSWMTTGYLRLAAAVVVTAVSMATLYYVFAPPPAGPSAVELARASAEAELVLGYTAKALAATRHAAANRVLASKVSPAMRGQATPAPRRP
jgi:predicted anti-sigma-YlaC factor YlaD